MLIRFNVKNVLSFSSRPENESEEFSMIAGKVRSKKEHIFDDGHIKLLKFAAIYGANAAGKSNLVKAMNLMKTIVLRGLPDGHTEKYCKTQPDNQNKPSYFEMELKLGEKYYSYGFEVILSQSKFISEWLVELHPNNEETILFNRDIKAGTYEFNGELAAISLVDKLNVYAEDIATDPSVLFLTLMNTNKKTFYQNNLNAACLRDIYVWYASHLDISYPDQPVSNYAYMAKSDRDQVEDVCRLIAAFGIGITDYRLVEAPLEKALNGVPKQNQDQILANLEQKLAELRAVENGPSRLTLIMRSHTNFFMITLSKTEDLKCQTIEFRHADRETYFNLEEESDGTVRILDLLEILLAGAGKTFVLDELDRCLHPALTYKFVETFLQLAIKQDIQLIVTTHESRLMDFDLLRRDEIWFVDKKKNGESDIYSLEEYNARFDQKIDKAYLEGRYGGVPIFNSVFPVAEE